MLSFVNDSLPEGRSIRSALTRPRVFFPTVLVGLGCPTVAFLLDGAYVWLCLLGAAVVLGVLYMNDKLGFPEENLRDEKLLVQFRPAETLVLMLLFAINIVMMAVVWMLDF